MRISCCRDCPNVGCGSYHDKCEKYLEEKSKYENQKEQYQKYKQGLRGISIKKGDFLGDDGQLKYFQYGKHRRKKKK